MHVCSFIHGLVLFLRMETFPGRSRLPILMANPSADERKTILWYISSYFSPTFKFYMIHNVIGRKTILLYILLYFSLTFLKFHMNPLSSWKENNTWYRLKLKILKLVVLYKMNWNTVKLCPRVKCNLSKIENYAFGFLWLTICSYSWCRDWRQIQLL